MGKIKIQGRASKLVECDVVEFMITIHATDSSLSKAISKVREDTEKLLKSLNEMGFEMKDIHLGDDATEKDYGRNKPIYSCKRKINFLTQFNAALNNRIYKIVEDYEICAYIDTKYSYSKEKELRKVLLKEALLDSKAKAQLLAETNNQMVTGIEEINDGADKVFLKEAYPVCACASANGLSDQLAACTEDIEESIVVSWNIE